jgi:hypothetical protein
MAPIVSGSMNSRNASVVATPVSSAAPSEVRPASLICEVVSLEDVVLSDGVEARPLAHLVLDGVDLCGDVVARCRRAHLAALTSVTPAWSQPSMVLGASSTIFSSVA